MKMIACLLHVFIAVSIISCQDTPKTRDQVISTDSMTPAQTHLAANALKGLRVANGLEVKLFAAEPMLRNPTNIDVDDRGRVWVTEAYNYRPQINGNPVNPEGDRIIILEDTNHDGRADTSKVFYQGPELNAPLGICVLGDRVIVSQSPNIWVFFDDNHDDKADRKEILFQGIGGEQHDHGAHAFIPGPDGKLYFNIGNEGTTIKDKNNKSLMDDEGDAIAPPKYKMGMVFRCNPDGSNLECMAQNFRNNYEVAVDSYGTMWQSDNDDDGNRGVRINYVMQYGNYGYVDEMSGASWSSGRINMEDSIPYRHWHLNDPGVVPNLLQTGAGSPTGIVFYEGSLLPEKFRHQMIHCDAGVNVVRAYPVTKQDAGYSATIADILKNETDKWFRPADVAVAPDGSLIVADWYDPGVGGHAAGDQLKGRIYRIAPPGSTYEIPKYDYASSLDAIKALQNPNLCIRHHAYQSLKNMGDSAIGDLNKLWRSNGDPTMRARAFWLLSRLPAVSDSTIFQAVQDPLADIRIIAIRATVDKKKNITEVVARLVNDPDAQVRRECALALRHLNDKRAAELWAELAARHDGRDRWYLEALGIGADHQWDRFFKAFIDKVQDPMSKPGYRDIVWRARTDQALPYLSRLALEPSELYTRLRYFRAFDFHKGPAKTKYLLRILADTANNDPEYANLVLNLLDRNSVVSSPLARSALKTAVTHASGQEFIDLVNRYQLRTESKRLEALALDSSGSSIGEDAALALIRFGGLDIANDLVFGKDTTKASRMMNSLGGAGNMQAIALLKKAALSSKLESSLRNQAAVLIGRSGEGQEEVMRMLDSKSIPASLKPILALGIKDAWQGNIRKKAQEYLSEGSPERKKEPVLAKLLALKPDATHGKQVFTTTCGLCHQVGAEGKNYGPQLTEIGNKLPKEELLKSIVHPSAGISFGYEGWELKLRDGSILPGIISSRTAKETELKFPGGSTNKIPNTDVVSRKKMKESMMTEGLYEHMTDQDLADLLEFVSRLKK